MYEITICGNDETICGGYTDESTAPWHDEIRTAYVEAAARVVTEARLAGREVDHRVDRNFAEWHGGRHYHLFAGSQRFPGYRTGLVCCHGDDLPKWVKNLVNTAEAAGSAARHEAIKQIEAAALDVPVE